jgi:hypothetical protein
MITLALLIGWVFVVPFECLHGFITGKSHQKVQAGIILTLWVISILYYCQL